MLALIAAARILEPPPERNAGQWADQNRVLPKDSPEPGPWRTDRVPFWRDIYSAFSNVKYDTVVVICGSQMSKTEGIFNVIGHRFDDNPVPTLYIGPTEKQVKSISKDRIHKMLTSTDSLWAKTEKGQRYATYEKFIAGTRLGFAWAGSATELASHPAGLVLLDERSRMGLDVGGEGDPVTLARARTKNYVDKKIGIFSTPTLEDQDPTWKHLDNSTLHFWAWPCLHCLKYFVPQLSLLIWPEGSTAAQAKENAIVCCPHCGGEMHSKDKPQLNACGRYIRHRRLADKETVERPVLGHYTIDEKLEPNSTAGFWISGLASPWVTFGDVAKVLVEAYRSGDMETIQAVVNTYGGECYRVKGDAPEWQEVSANRLEYPPRGVGHDIQKITAGVDVQKLGLYYVIRGWGYQSESWLLENEFIAGETEHGGVWEVLRDILTAPIGDKMICRAFIDSGYRPGDEYSRPDHAVYTFCRQMQGLAFPTKGADTLDAPFKFRNIDYSIGGTVIKNGVKLFHLNTDYFKKWIHARVRWPEDQPGGWHLHHETSEDYCKQIVAEELLITSSGRVKWVRKQKDNHYLDCEVNATAAAYVENVHKLPKVSVDDTPATGKENTVTHETDEYERRSLF